MKIYLKKPFVPELAALPKEEREAILHECRTGLLRDKQVWLWLGLFAGILCFILKICYRPDTFAPLLIGAVIGGAIGGFIFSQIIIRVDLAHMRAAISKRNETANQTPEPADTLGLMAAALAALTALLVKLKVPAMALSPVGSMVVSIWIYAKFFGWPFAVGFVLLFFVHECGHILAAKWFHLPVSAPVFIPFFGAYVLFETWPSAAWAQAWVGFSGPLLGTLGAVGCEGLYLATGQSLYQVLAYAGFFLNLFNLVPIPMLDGGCIVKTIFPPTRVMGLVGWGIFWAFVFGRHLSLLLVLVLLSLLIVWLQGTWRRKWLRIKARWRLAGMMVEEEKNHLEMTPSQRWTMTALYFGLVAGLMLGVWLTHLAWPPA